MSISFSKKRWDQIITFLGILGFVLCLFLSSRVFPSAAIDLSIPRSMIRQEAIAYMETIEPEISSYETTQRSSSSGFSSIYLQKTIGIPETSRRISEEQLPIYYWDHRYFRPQQQEEFDLELSPQGEVIGYYHTIADTIEGEDLSEEKAQAIAEDYLSQERQWDLADWELIDSSSVLQQSDRRDHTFGWKSKKFAVGEAELRLSVTVQGDQIGGYNYFIKVPQEFSRDFEEDQNLAYFFTRISYLVGYYSSLAVAFLFFIVAIAQGKINWKKGLWLPAIVGVVYLATSFNSLILSKSWYWTTENYTLFWLERIFYIFFNLSMVVVPIYFLWMGGQQLIKKVWPSEDKALPRGLNRWRIFNRSYWRGLMATGIGLGAVNIFYWIAINYFSAWSPMGVDYSNFFATPFPFLSPLASGVLPSVSEELVSRFVGITLIYWLFRSRFLALLIPGAIWATAHLAYVRDPFYLRGIELTLKAVFVYGLLFLVFDLLTVIVSHLAFNALLGTGLLLTTNDPYLVANGVIVILILLAPLAFGLWQSRRQSYRSESYEYRAIATTDLESFRDDLNDFPEEQCFQNDATWRNLGIWIGDELKGFIFVEIHGDIADIQLIYIDPAYRRCYYGTKLLAEMQRQLKASDISQLKMTVLTANDALQKFWRNQNWQSKVNTFVAPST